MPKEKALPMTVDQLAWVHRRLAEMAAFCAICAEETNDDRERAALAALMAIFQTNAQSMSAQGVAEWQNVASKVLTIIVEEVKHHASDSQRDHSSDNRRDYYHAVAVSIRELQERSQRRAN